MAVAGVPVIGGAAVASAPNELTPQELAEGWILLFDGATLFGWKPATKANWAVAGGTISVSQGEPGLLVTTSQFGNYVLKVDFRAARGTESGVLLRTPPKVAPQEAAAKCYEVSIAPPGNPYPTGSLAGRERIEGGPENAGWQALETAVNGSRITVKLDGKAVLDYDPRKPVSSAGGPLEAGKPCPARGHIGLRFNRGKIEFRNIKLKPLGMEPLASGKDLAGWKVYAPSVATVTPEGWIHLTGGKGQLESERQFADFTFQLEVFVNGRGLNSGVFFRSIPGEMWNGYESQIHNGFKNGDRSQPADCGTGGIFRRQNARRVVANDGEWFAKTIHADGPHMAVWVNGYQVSDWTDSRAPAENPRKGLRLKAGTMIFQAHDPTADFFFRNLRIAELARPAP
jgi:hypothetical protein